MTAILPSHNFHVAPWDSIRRAVATPGIVVVPGNDAALSPTEGNMPMAPALATTATARKQDMEDWLARFAAYLDSTRRLSPRTVDTYVKYCRIAFVAMGHLAGWRGEIDVDSLANFLAAEAARGMQASSLRTQMFSLSAYYRYLDRLGVSHLSPLDDVKPPRRVQSDREFYTEEDADAIVSRALAATDRDDHLGGVILSTFDQTGLRLTELVGLRTEQLDLALRRLRVLGKGQKKRTVPFSESLAATLDEYVRNVRPTLRGAKSPFLFVNPRSERLGGNADIKTTVVYLHLVNDDLQAMSTESSDRKGGGWPGDRAVSYRLTKSRSSMRNRRSLSVTSPLSSPREASSRRSSSSSVP